ncbi:MAG: PEP-utilizing enzyme, partial [Chitinophagaceae bacterium]|nr:PEP-utilizing enzyme [Chitinophagaceae bacterium]
KYNIHILEENMNSESVQGETIYGKDKINGEVYIYKNKEELEIQNKTRDNHILIIPMIEPTHFHLLKGVKAIICEHGGTLSHAAIHMREYKIPCIINVKQITKLFKDNDKINIDLNTGIIEKL